MCSFPFLVTHLSVVVGNLKECRLQGFFINQPWSPGGCEEGGKGGNHRTRPGFNITASSYPLLRSSQTVHARDPAIRYERR